MIRPLSSLVLDLFAVASPWDSTMAPFLEFFASVRLPAAAVMDRAEDLLGSSSASSFLGYLAEVDGDFSWAMDRALDLARCGDGDAWHFLATHYPRHHACVSAAGPWLRGADAWAMENAAFVVHEGMRAGEAPVEGFAELVMAWVREDPSRAKCVCCLARCRGGGLVSVDPDVLAAMRASIESLPEPLRTETAVVLER
jgi:hypothetical protein